MGKLRRCELCSKAATLHCEADSAYLCWGCDAKVHGANFLVARHVRIILCCRCHGFTEISTLALCPNVDRCLCSGCSNYKTTKDGVIVSSLKNGFCAENKDDHRLLEGSRNPALEVSLSYSEEDSSLGSQQKKVVITRYSDMKVQAILRRWYRYLSLRSPSTVGLAMHLVEKGLNNLGGLFRQKWRVCVAASLWLAATVCENEACLPSIKKVEECSGVPSKLIDAVASKLPTILDRKMHEEGWAESDTVSPSG